MSIEENFPRGGSRPQKRKLEEGQPKKQENVSYKICNNSINLLLLLSFYLVIIIDI